MRKIVRDTIKKLKKERLYSLSPEEFRAYFEHRRDRLISDKRVLVRNELEYLLCETGPGNLRFDPRYLTAVLEESVFAPSYLVNLPDMVQVAKQKREIETHILNTQHSKQVNTILLNIIGPYMQDCEITSEYPLVVQGTLGGVPVNCLIRNGEWIFPNPELFSFIRRSNLEKRFPILVAKKISGILFPVFKNLCVLGLNTYKIYLPQSSKYVGDELTQSDVILGEMRYSNQFYFADETKSPTPHGTNPAPESIANFLVTFIVDDIKHLYTKFMTQKISLAENFVDTVSQFRKSKASRNLLKQYTASQKLIRDLRG